MNSIIASFWRDFIYTKEKVQENGTVYTNISGSQSLSEHNHKALGVPRAGAEAAHLQLMAEAWSFPLVLIRSPWKPFLWHNPL